MKPINRNALAKRITEREALVQSLSIAQVKEVLRITLEELTRFPASSVLLLLEKMNEEIARS